jgi:hypothetical protein
MVVGTGHRVYRDVSYMGFFTGGAVEAYEKPAWVDGCQWFRSCLQCRWNDCVSETLSKYDSENSASIRRRMMSRLVKQGFKAELVAEFFYVPIEEVTALDSSQPLKVSYLDAEKRARVRQMVIDMRRNGISEYETAALSGLSTRQVRRLCEDVKGIVRGRYHTKSSQPVVAVVSVVSIDDQYTRDVQTHIGQHNLASSWTAPDKSAINVGCTDR